MPPMLNNDYCRCIIHVHVFLLCCIIIMDNKIIMACLGPQVEAGSGLGHEGHRIWPADILIPHWDLGKPAALDLTVTSTLNYGSGCDKWICSSGH